MSLFNKIVNFLKNLFKKDKVRVIEAPKQEMPEKDSNVATQVQGINEHYNNSSDISNNNRRDFIDSLKVNVKDINTEEKCIIETPICVGDGLGIQTGVSA